MSPLYLHNNKLIVVGGALGASKNCCCDSSSSSSDGAQECNDCYRIDYNWTIVNCPVFGETTTVTGSVLLDDVGIVCYVGDGIASDPYTISFINLCGGTTFELSIFTGASSTTIITFGYLTNTYFISGDIGCGGGIGVHNFSTPDEEELEITVSLANNGTCDCTGFIEV